MKYSIVIPCYRSSHTIRQVVTETSKELDRLGRTPYEFILVDDFLTASLLSSWPEMPVSTMRSWQVSTTQTVT